MTPIEISPDRFAMMIRAIVRIGGQQFVGLPLWSAVSEFTLHGSTISGELCRQVGLDPGQVVGNGPLKAIEGLRKAVGDA